jgi:hypothetical protein
MGRAARILFLIVGMAAITAWHLPGATAAGKEQIVFSGEADGPSGEVGFWVWCAVDEAGNYDDCSGAIHFDDLKLARHVEGEVSEPEEGIYVMDVASSDGAIACTLTNEPPITRGPTNTVNVSCDSPSSTATADDAVIGGNA